MRYRALAADYDGTLAHHGLVDAATLAALDRVRASQRKLLLVTGRELNDLQAIFPHLHIFACVVAENGGLLYWPATGKIELLAEAPQEKFVHLLHERGVAPVSIGRVIV